MSIYLSGILQGKAYRIIQNQLTEALLPYNISIPEWKILGLLQFEKGIKITEIADILDVESPLVTRLINRMEKIGIVTKTQSDTDKRSTLIVITKKGTTLIEKADIEIRSILMKLFKGVTHEEMNTYKKILETVVENGQIGTYKKMYIVK